MFISRILRTNSGALDQASWSKKLEHLRPGGTWFDWSAPGFAIGQFCPSRINKAQFETDANRLILTLGTPRCLEQPTHDVLSCWRQNLESISPPDLSNWEGLFSVIGYDSRCHEQVAVTDRTGIWPIYFSEDENGVWISSSSLAIACMRPVSFNPDALTCLRSIGHLVNDISLFTEIKRLDAGMRLTLRKGKLVVERWWSPPSPKHQGTLKNEVQQFVENATANLHSRCISSREIHSTLTAGLDSRCILALVRAAKLNAKFFTSNSGDSIEVEVARELTKKLELDWFEFTPPVLGVNDYRQITEMSSLLCDGENHPFRGSTYWAAALSNLDYPILFGMGGEIWRRYWAKQERVKYLLKGKTPLDRLVRYRCSGSPIPNKLLSPIYQNDPHMQIVELLRPSYEFFADRDVEDRLEAMYLAQRIRRWASVHITTMAWWIDPEMPFLGQRLVDQSYAMTRKVRKDDELLRLAIWQCDPDAGRLPHNGGYHTLPNTHSSIINHFTSLHLDSKKLLQKIDLLKKKCISSGGTSNMLSGIPTYQEAFEDYLMVDKMASSFLYNKNALNVDILSHWGRSAGTSQFLNGVLGLEIAINAAKKLQV